MFKLSYQDYMECVKEKESVVEEESEDYHAVPWVTWEASNNKHDKIFLLEKTEDSEEIANIMDEIIEKIETEEERMLLIIVMKDLLREKLTKEEIEKLIKKIKGGGNNMERVKAMIRAENRRIRKEGRIIGRKEGIKEGMCKVVKEMKKQGLEIKLIKEITGFSEEEIGKIN